MTKILYVDDEPDIRDIAVLSLRRDPSFDVRPCGSGREALEAVQEWRPDLVMLDVVMPDMDGPAILTRLREMPGGPDLTVLFITARTQGPEVDRFLALGADGVIAKPFDPLTLAAIVKGHLQAT
jgi:two-component system OmpR family response regulator